MAVLYVKEQGTIIQKRSERIVVTRSGKTLLEISIENVESITVIGNVQLTTQAMHMMMQKGIEIHHFTFSGKYLGSTTAESSKNIFLRLAQYDLYQSKKKRMKIACSIVENKIRNQIYVIENHRWKLEEKEWKEEANQILSQIYEILDKVKNAETTSQLMGLEGKASHLYFKSYGKMFQCEIKFNGRNRRPPKDPINVIISLGYTFLMKEVSSALEAESFEMYMGFLHGIRYGRKSLPLDIVEEFRQPVIDRMTLKLFNKNMIQKYDFIFEEDKVILNEEGFKKFCKEFERWMVEQGFRTIIQEQAKKLKNAIQQKGEYIPFCLENNKNI